MYQPPLTVNAEIPDRLSFLWEPWRYKVAYGGRGSAKSWSFARVLVASASMQPLRTLCARELQGSLDESVKALIELQIKLLNLRHMFRIRETYIEAIGVESEFIFEGLRYNTDGIKSMEGLDRAWVEEAQRVSHNSWETLIPTMRKKGSEIWVSFNPADANDPTYRRFVLNPPPDAKVVLCNYYHNPFFKETELERERVYLQRTDPDAYANVWLGKTRTKSAAQVLNGKWRIGLQKDFDEVEQLVGNYPYYGADWGFATDPTTLIRCRLVGTTLYITHEVYRHKLENNEITEAFLKVPGAGNHTIRGDSARPETIAYLNRGQEPTPSKPNGVPALMVEGVAKPKGSVEDGIAFLRALDEIVINPSCIHTIEEARLWSYKVDKLTGDVQPEVADGNDHCWDAVRYALQPVIAQSTKFDGMIRYMAQLSGEMAAAGTAQQ